MEVKKSAALIIKQNLPNTSATVKTKQKTKQKSKKPQQSRKTESTIMIGMRLMNNGDGMRWNMVMQGTSLPPDHRGTRQQPDQSCP